MRHAPSAYQSLNLLGALSSLMNIQAETGDVDGVPNSSKAIDKYLALSMRDVAPDAFTRLYKTFVIEDRCADSKHRAWQYGHRPRARAAQIS
jgi:hypothetical protein